ncbi:MAG: DUF6174 domain-containing protein [Ignavibacteriaceae bacterium]
MKASFFILSVMFILYGCNILQDEYNSYDYSIEQRRDCFCPQAGIWVKLFVKADTVSTAIRISDNYILSYNEFRRYKSINELFNEIALRDTAKYEVKIEMDSKNNYPAYVYFNPKPIVNGDTVQVIFDAQLAFITRNYNKLN